jgi:hypothetical protein
VKWVRQGNMLVQTSRWAGWGLLRDQVTGWVRRPESRAWSMLVSYSMGVNRPTGSCGRGRW